MSTNPQIYNAYLADVSDRLWQYRDSRYAANANYFDQPTRTTVERPPVFDAGHKDHNIILDWADPRHIQMIQSLPSAARHRHFGSMKSSQALAQSFFGALAVYGKADLLSTLLGDGSSPMFPDQAAKFEWSLPNIAGGRNVLNENPVSPTSVDVFFDDGIKIAVECKFTEFEIGPCSKGLNACRRGFYNSPCLISAAGVRYWDYVPDLFHWFPDVNCGSCPLKLTYQLVRNILTVSVRSDGTIDTAGHAVLVYDERNPAFKSGGTGMAAWNEVKQALKMPIMLQKCSWQQLVKCLDSDTELVWLREGMQAKYNF